MRPHWPVPGAVAAALLLTMAPTPSASAAAPPVRYVAVSVATVWHAPDVTRAVDAPALANPADPRRWVASMTDDQKRALGGRADTQALYGTRVLVLGTRGRWTHVAVPSQPSPKSSLGYPGWVPTRQLTAAAPAAASVTAVVSARTAWVWRSPATIGRGADRVVELSYDTRLPVRTATSSYVQVVLLGGAVRTLRRADVVLHPAGTSWAPTAAKAVAQATRFLGLSYLWSGTSGFGYDCSGLTYSAYRYVGVLLPRDAAAQARRGRAVAKADLRPGDLVFVRNRSGTVVHVAMYVGRRGGTRTVIEAPHTGAAARLTPLSAWTWQYAGARRYVG